MTVQRVELRAQTRLPAATGVDNRAAPSRERTRNPDSRSNSEPRQPDSRSQEWLLRLTDGGTERDQAIADLHRLLVKAARFTLANQHAIRARAVGESISELAVEAADDALVAILAHLDDYRGESSFTTWAWKFAFLEASVALRRRRWLGREIPLEDDGWAAISRESSPQRQLEQRELLAALRRAVDGELTPHQRMVFVTLALNEVPVDVLAERMGTTRGALYKTLSDARRKLRDHLAASELGPSTWSQETAVRASDRARAATHGWLRCPRDRAR